MYVGARKNSQSLRASCVASQMADWHNTLSKIFSLGSGWPRWARYASTIAIVLATGWIWLQLDIDQPYLLFFPAIFFCAAAFDRGSGFVATLLSALFAARQLLAPLNTAVRTRDEIQLALFVIIGLAVAWLVEALRTRIIELSKEKEVSERLAQERKVLLDELAHRTRNDLANVVTLLRRQARQTSADAKESLNAAADRVQTIARVHRRLEVSGERVVVNSKQYLEELCDDLRTTRLASGLIQLDCQVECHSIGVEKAVPLGLIVNELVTNAAKHAFEGKSYGRIAVSFSEVGDSYYLQVSDDGIGYDTSSGSAGLGHGLLNLLASQLGSTLKTHADSRGTTASVGILKHVGPSRLRTLSPSANELVAK
jgi:two-component system, sensor histidine kinase PdtaS